MTSRVPILNANDQIPLPKIPDLPTSKMSQLVEFIQDTVAAMLVSGANVTLTYNDAAGTVQVTAAGGDAEVMRDTIGAALVGTNGVAVAVNDAADTITLSISGLTASQIGDATAAGRALLTAADTAAQRGALSVYSKAEGRSDTVYAANTSPLAPVGTSLVNWLVANAQSANFTVSAPSGTPTDRNMLAFRFIATAAVTITWNAIFRGYGGTTLPTAIASGKSVVGFALYNAVASKWDVLVVKTEA